MSRKRWIGIGVAAAVVALVVAGVVVIRSGGDAGPTEAVATYLRAWERFDGDAMATVVDNPVGVAGAVAAMQEQLEAAGARFVAGRVARDGNTARVPYTADIDVAAAGPWSYGGELVLARTEGKWRVQWMSEALHPDLHPGLRFAVTRTWAERAPILGAGGGPLVATTDVAQVSLHPARMNQAEVEAALQQALGVTPAEVQAALAQTWVTPDSRVPIIDVSLERLAQVRSLLEPVDGVIYPRQRGRIGPTENFAAHVVGTVGEVTAERLAELGPPYEVGDVVGLSGIEATNERRLAGTPAADVQLRDAGENVVQVLHRFPGTPPQAVRLTIDRAVQLAADEALAGVTERAAIVAVDAATGDIRAVASRPLNEFNRALAGQYPPGSTFKIVTAAALLAGGLRPDDPVDCPAQTVVGGRVFGNFEGGALGTVPFSTAFAQSCNTAFVGLSARLSGEALARAATGFGFGRSYDLGLPVAGGKFPLPGDATELAEAAIGQAKVEASPLEMATVAATVSAGQWRTPRLMADGPAGDVQPLDPGVATTLQRLMTSVVREGTGTAAARPGQEIAGKTGTAEFGTASPPATHAWFVGYRGGLAFAVLVEGGGVGGRVAAPLAAKFLDAAPR